MCYYLNVQFQGQRVNVWYSNHFNAVIQREENWFRVLLPSVNKKYSVQEGCGFIVSCLVLKRALSSDLHK